MQCYIGGEPAIGQCRRCGRFYCLQHSAERAGVIDLCQFCAERDPRRRPGIFMPERVITPAGVFWAVLLALAACGLLSAVAAFILSALGLSLVR